jgi:hypothetical protein
MNLTPETLAAWLQFAVKFGIDAAIAIAPLFKGGATIDDAIAALQAAKTKTAQDYKAEALASVVPTTPTA